MKKTPYDPILTEMHAIKDAISAEFNHDVDALFEHLRKLERESIAFEQPPVGQFKQPAKRTIRKTGIRPRKVGVKTPS